MEPASPLLALRLAGQDHALEPNRDYLLGTAADCDLRLPAAAAPHHARLLVSDRGVELVDLGSAEGTRHNGVRIARTQLATGDVLHFGPGDVPAIVVRDEGTAALVPVPAMRQAAHDRRQSGVRRAAMALRRQGEETFQELMAHELRRAPWLALSLAFHLVLLSLLWILLPVHRVSGDAPATVNIDFRGEPPNPLDGPATPPDVAIEPSEPVFAPTSTPEPPAPTLDAPAPDRDGSEPQPKMLRENAPIGVRHAPTQTAVRGGRAEAAIGAGSGGFQKTVGELRKSGLEIVFVFDSTGSMTTTIRDTKTTIAQMLAVLRVLVPDARIGLVTYRDRGSSEQYLVRQVPLGHDFWRASNFVQFITAEGGGDLPEDVRAGMRAAFQQDWRRGARRVIVLAGDAPPHPEDLARLLAEVRSFTQDGRSFVHTLVASPDLAGRDAHETFADIARAGKGLCQGLDARDRVLQRVLTLAFGREFDQDLALVERAVKAEAERIDVRALDLARRGGPELAAALRENPVPQALWNALVRRPRRAVVEQLVDLLGDADTREPTRQAIAAALQRIFDLALPPIDPFGETSPTPYQLAQLRGLAARLGE